MEKGGVYFCAIIAVAVAMFVPIAFVSGRGNYRKASKKACPPFETPKTAVGHYVCSSKYENKKWTCLLQCPEMLKEPKKDLIVSHYCKGGRWKSNPIRDKSRCVARHTVGMVEQKLANPKLINDLLNNYLNNSYSYLSLAYFFDRADVHLPGFHKFFLSHHEKNIGKAMDIMSYINKRGGWIELHGVPKSSMRELMHQAMKEGHLGLVAMETALAMERESHSLVSDIIKRVQNRNNEDPHMMHVLEDDHLSYKVKVIKEIADYITRLRSFQATGEDYALGEYEVDNNLQ